MTISGPPFPNANGPVKPTTAFPTSIAAGTTYDTGVTQSHGGIVSAWVTSSQALTLTINTYADYAGTILVETVTQSVSANTLTNKLTTSGKIFSTFNMTLANATGSPATISKIAIVQ